MFRDNMDKTAIAMAKLGANIGGAANAATNMAKMMGVQTPAQRQKQVQMGLSEGDLASDQYGEFQNMLESESGQSFINELKSATAPERFQKLQTYLQTAIAGHPKQISLQFLYLCCWKIHSQPDKSL